MRGRLDRLLWIGPVAFLIAACAFGALDANFSTDTWIGLAAGRQLLEQLDWTRFQETFPRHDTFSYTFYQQTWLNQNWLTHLGQYWLYDRLGPSSVVYGTWAVVACVCVLVLLAAYWRTGSWLAAWLAAALVGIGGRDFLEPRAATVGLLCAAGTWALICAIEGQGERRRWWPVLLLLPVMLFWSNAHGGFVFGYGLLGLYVGHWLVVRSFRGRRASLAASGNQIAGIVAVLVVATVAATVLGPFGISNFVHPEKVASSKVFRDVTEWQPAYSNVMGVFPPMARFWSLLGLIGIGLLLLWLAGRAVRRSGANSAPEREPRWSLFDLAVVLICLCMTLWARRFAPLLYVMSAPVLAVWVMCLVAPLALRFRDRATPALKAGAALAAVVIGWITWTTAERELIDGFREQPAVDLLERARGYLAMREALHYVQENRLRVNLLADFGSGGSIMFYAPIARVLIDGRGEQLYTEPHYRRYWSLLNRSRPGHELRRDLDATGTNAVLVPRTASTTTLRSSLQGSSDWPLVFLSGDYVLFVRDGSPALTRLGELVREGKEWRPSRDGTITPDAQASRAMVLLNTAPADAAQALTLLKGAIDRQLVLGHTFYPVITRLLSETGGAAAVTDYLSTQAARLNADPALDPQTRTALLASLAESRRRLER